LEESRKYYTNLSWENSELLVKAIINITTNLNNIYEGKKSPKDFAGQVANDIKSRKNLAGIFTIYKLDLSPDESLSPDELDNLLCKNFLQTTQNDTGDLIGRSEFSDVYYIKSNRRSEIVKILVDNGMLTHLYGKKNIPQSHGYGKKTSPGRPSSYTMSDELEELKILLSNTDVLELLIQCLDRTKILYNALKYLAISFFYLLRDIDKSKLYDAFKSVSTKTHEEIHNTTIDYILIIKPFSMKLGDVELERFGEEALGASMRTILEDKSNFLVRLLLILSLSSG
jgi:hypothetical protein